MESKDNKIMGIGFIIALILISLLIAGLIIIAFLFSENRFVITKAIITLLCLLVIIVLSCRFDEIHFGHLFEVSKVSKENNNIVQIKKTDLEKQKMEQEETQRSNVSEYPNKTLDISMFHNLILDKYLGTGLKDKIQKNMSLVEYNQSIDQISCREVCFDALLDDNNKQIFIDVMKGKTYAFYYDRIYIKLNKILCYKRVTQKEAQLLLLIPKRLDGEKEFRDSFFFKTYAPAIQNNLLRIEYVDYKNEEFELCLVENKKNGRKGDK